MNEHKTRTPRARAALHTVVAAVAALSLLTAAAAQAQNATAVLFNLDPPGFGFNDPTPVQPVGGNTGTTLGQQRLNVYLAAANEWVGTLTSNVPVTVGVSFEALRCNADEGVIASARPNRWFRDFPGALRAGTWYPRALTQKLFGNFAGPINTADDLDISITTNVNLGAPDCVAGATPYLGLDGRPGAGQINLLSTAVHELGHGLGFTTLTDTATGEAAQGLPSVFDHFVTDRSAGLPWPQLTAAQRAASAVNARNVVWTGARVTADAAAVLGRGAPDLRVFAAGLSGFNPQLSPADFGRQIAPITSYVANLGRVIDQSNGSGLACQALSAANRARVNGRIAVLDRGICAFVDKARHVQQAGALAVLIVDNQPQLPPPVVSAVAPDITIPVLLIPRAEGTRLKNAIPASGNTPVATLRSTNGLYGADTLGRVLLNTPNEFSDGSSLVHWDPVVRPNQLMEPAQTPDAPVTPRPPRDLTRSLMADIGW